MGETNIRVDFEPERAPEIPKGPEGDSPSGPPLDPLAGQPVEQEIPAAPKMDFSQSSFTQPAPISDTEPPLTPGTPTDASYPNSSAASDTSTRPPSPQPASPPLFGDGSEQDLPLSVLAPNATAVKEEAGVIVQQRTSSPKNIGQLEDLIQGTQAEIQKLVDEKTIRIPEGKQRLEQLQAQLGRLQEARKNSSQELITSSRFDAKTPLTKDENGNLIVTTDKSKAMSIQDSLEAIHQYVQSNDLSHDQVAALKKNTTAVYANRSWAERLRDSKFVSFFMGKSSRQEAYEGLHENIQHLWKSGQNKIDIENTRGLLGKDLILSPDARTALSIVLADPKMSQQLDRVYLEIGKLQKEKVVSLSDAVMAMSEIMPLDDQLSESGKVTLEQAKAFRNILFAMVEKNGVLLNSQYNSDSIPIPFGVEKEQKTGRYDGEVTQFQTRLQNIRNQLAKPISEFGGEERAHAEAVVNQYDRAVEATQKAGYDPSGINWFYSGGRAEGAGVLPGSGWQKESASIPTDENPSIFKATRLLGLSTGNKVAVSHVDIDFSSLGILTGKQGKAIAKLLEDVTQSAKGNEEKNFESTYNTFGDELNGVNKEQLKALVLKYASQMNDAEKANYQQVRLRQ